MSAGLAAPGGPFCVTAAGLLRRERFLGDVARARTALAGHDAVCNLAAGRYDFAVLLVAAMANGQTTVLPPSRAPGAVAACLEDWASPLTVEALAGLDLPASSGAGDGTLPAMSGPVHVFTSGSTGRPVRHLKTWAMLAEGARLTAEVIGRAGLAPGRTAIVGTTPHQHMYGLEAAIFAGLAHGFCLHDQPVFYPADLEQAARLAAEQGVEDIALATSPPHLRFLEDAVRALPQIRCVISATAPLSPDLARRLENGGARGVFEIYGSTETGSLAWRRSGESALWTPLEGFAVLPGAGAWFASAPHLPEAVPLGDDLELAGDGRFRLLGRLGDMVRVAGKRQSLGALNAALGSLPTIRDGVFLREMADDGDRLHLFIVPDSAGLPAEAIRQEVRAHLLSRVDPVFVPRRIHLVERLPRGETGKISAADQAALLREAGAGGMPAGRAGQRAGPAD